MMRRLRILTWSIHSRNLTTLAQLPHDWYLPVKPDGSTRYGGAGPGLLTRDNIHNVPASQVRDLDFDIVLYQHAQNYLLDQYELLTDEQRRRPQIYLEHNVPPPHPTDSKHPVDDPDVLLVHVTNFNRLMWDSNRTPTIVIEHSAAIDPTVIYKGHIERGITVINSLPRRGRRLGHDLFLRAREHVPLDVMGFENDGLDPIGEFAYPQLHHRLAEYRFLYSPVRYTSLPLAVVEAMLVGMPVVAFATTELPTVIEDGVTGYISCDPEVLIARMKQLLADSGLARRLGHIAQELAQERFGLERFVQDWNRALAHVTGYTDNGVGFYSNYRKG